MKTYRVSLAASIPANFEVVVKASSPEAAYNKAIEEYEEGNGDFQEVFDRPSLAMGEADLGEHDRHAPGVYIAELKGGNEIEV